MTCPSCGYVVLDDGSTCPNCDFSFTKQNIAIFLSEKGKTNIKLVKVHKKSYIPRFCKAKDGKRVYSARRY